MARRVAGILLPLLLGTTVHAATLCVNPGGTSGCFASVQAAVDAAASEDTITIAAGTYVETVLIEGKRLDVVGEDAATTIIDGGGAGRTITVVGPGTRLNLSQLRIQNAGPSFSSAGLTVSRSTATVTRCRITGNDGPGLSDDAGPFGGFERARLTVVETTIDGNAGPGIMLFAYSRATVVRSTISGNADSGIALRGRGNRAIVADSTISGNGTLGDGGGIYLIASSVKLVRSTVASNTAEGAGGGIFVDVRGRARSEATILADNAHMGAAANECALAAPSGPHPGGRFVSRGFNLIETACPFAGGAGLDITAQDPLLGPLQDNSGPTFTRALLGGSPALGAVTRGRTCREPDQRGVARTAPCDVGAFEAP
jgi:nitrous oxidase accessory protein NosD